MFDSIKLLMEKNRQALEDWINMVDQACRVSERDFRTEVFKKLTGAVWQMILSCNELTDNELIAKLRSCFSHTPMMNEAREELRNMGQLEHKSVSVYIYKWGRALYRSSEMHPENERHPRVIKDFISSLKKNIRNKIANKLVEMRQPPTTVERAFKLVCNVEKQLQVADSFELEFSSYHAVEINKMSAEESSGNEFKIDEVARGKKWGNTNNYNQKHSNFSNIQNHSNIPQQNKPQNSR